MEFIQQMQEKAARNPKSILFPESGEEMILRAASQVWELGIAKPVLLGRRDEITALAEGLNLSAQGFEFLDPDDEAVVDRLVERYLTVSDLFSEKALRRKFKTPLNFAAAAVKVGWADCLAAGYTCATGDVVLAAQMFIGMRPGISTASSLGIVEFPNWDKGSEGSFLVFTDCAVQPRPTAEELADIAVASSYTVRSLLGWEPRVAMLSFSTKGSAAHEDVDTVRRAVDLAREKAPNLLVDGEFQLDAAIVPAAAAKKVKEPSPVAGRANVLVFPNLGAGNIGIKITQIFCGTVAYGPMLQGFAKPVTDFSRSAPLEEIVGNLAMLVLQAGGGA